jgi:hypothetical protein
VPLPLTANFAASPVLCKGESTGKASVSVSGGLIPYQVSWLDHSGQMVSNTQITENLPAGWYKVLINDQSSCAGSNNFVIKDSVKITEPAGRFDPLAAAAGNSTCYQCIKMSWIKFLNHLKPKRQDNLIKSISRDKPIGKN